MGIPSAQWPKSWYDSEGRAKFRQPVCRLLKALYGHPDSGGIWELHCDSHLKKIGFVEVPSWRSVYFHDKLKVLLVVYVDDFKMAGPKPGIAEAWRLIREKIQGRGPHSVWVVFRM